MVTNDQALPLAVPYRLLCSADLVYSSIRVRIEVGDLKVAATIAQLRAGQCKHAQTVSVIVQRCEAAPPAACLELCTHLAGFRRVTRSTMMSRLN